MNSNSWPCRPLAMSRYALAVASACAGLTSQCAWAQTTAQLPTLPEVTVRSQKETNPSLTQPSMDAARKRIDRAPGGVDVIDAEDYLKGSAVTPADTLGFSPGVFVQSRIPGAEESRLSIRGSGIQRTFHGRGLKVLQDGVPINQADGAFDFQALEPLSARYVEVYRGASALQYGSTTLGGAINYVSPTGYDSPPFQLRGEVGSYGYLRGQASAAGVKDAADYYVTLTHSSQNGYQAHSEQSNQRLFANLGYRINDKLETRFYFLYALSDSELPGNLTKAEIGSNPRLANPGNVAGNQHRDFNLYRLSNKTTYAWGDQRIEFGAFYVYKALWHPIFQVLDINSNDYGMNLRYVSESPLGGRRNILTVGFSPVRGVATDDRYLNVAGLPGARTGQSDQTAVSLDLYAENQHYLNHKFALVLGAQASRSSRKLEDRFFGDGVNNSFDIKYSQVSPKIGARYEFTPAMQVFGNISRSFEPPSFGELAGGPAITQVRKQSAWTFEVGSRGRVADGAWDVAYYRAKLKDELLAQNDGTGAPLGTVNAPDTLHQGVELGLSWTFSKSFLLRGAYLWNDFRFDGHPVYGNNVLPGIPKQFLRAELLYTSPGGFYVGPNLEWSPQNYPVDMANTLFADSYAILGFKLGQRAAKGVSWFFDARNLTDKKYAATTGVIADSRSPGVGGQNARQFNPGLGRSVFAGIEWRM
jgi:iron complex outermembrane receptor protein